MHAPSARALMGSALALLGLAFPGVSKASTSAPELSEPPGCAQAETQFEQALGERVQVCLPLPIDASADMPALPGQSAELDVDSPCAPVPQDRCETWISEFYNGPGNGVDYTGEMFKSAHTVVTSPDGKTVYVAGSSDGDPGSVQDWDLVVLALDAATGQQRWVKRFPGLEEFPGAAAYAIAAGPATVFVTGYVYSGDETQGVTLGFDAATGEQRWLRSFPGSAYDMAATPDGRRVFVTGAQLVKTPTGTRVDGVTIAYDGATGAPVWARSVTDPEWHAYGIVNHRIATNADGSRVVVAASRTLREGPSMGITVSLVVTTYDGAAKPDPAAEGTAISQADYPTYGVLPAGLVLNRKGNRAYLNEWSNEYGTQVLTIGVDTNRGRVLWSHRFAGVNGYATFSFPWYYQPIALSPDEQTVYVAGYEGYVNGTVSGFDLAAIWADTGFRKWEQARTSGNTTVCWGCGPSITVSREGQIVMAGRQPAVFAYQSAAYGFNPNGGLLWTRVFRDGRTATWNALTPAPDANRVYIAGSAGTYTATATDRSVDIVVAAYEAA